MVKYKLGPPLLFCCKLSPEISDNEKGLLGYIIFTDKIYLPII